MVENQGFDWGSVDNKADISAGAKRSRSRNFWASQSAVKLGNFSCNLSRSFVASDSGSRNLRPIFTSGVFRALLLIEN